MRQSGSLLSKRSRRGRTGPLTKSACPSVPVPYVDRRYHSSDECSNWRYEATRIILEMEPDLVILGNAAAFYDLPKQEWKQAFASLLVTLAEDDIASLVLWGVPRAPSNRRSACHGR